MLAGRMLFRDLVALFFESSQLEASTRKSYASHCRAHLRPAFGDRPVCEVDAAEVGRWMNAQQKAQVSVRTRVATRTTLSAILQFAVDNARLTHDPVRGTRGPARPRCTAAGRSSSPSSGRCCAGSSTSTATRCSCSSVLAPQQLFACGRAGTGGRCSSVDRGA